MRVLVTGVNGYIGSHTAKKLAEHGHDVYGFDIAPSINNVRKYLRDYYEDDARKAIVYDCDVYVHLAGMISVEESVRDPWKYFDHNVNGTMNMVMNNYAGHYIFASTATAFNPANPYAYSKLMAEEIIKASGKDHTIFRFFNVAGSDGEFGQIGEATHLIRICAEAAAGKRPCVLVYGDDYDTEDGTCVRDYIHVEDLTDGIVNAIYQPKNTPFECVGNGVGYSVKEVIKTMQKVTKVKFHSFVVDRRKGDVPYLMIPIEAGRSDLINPKRSLEEMCRSAYEFERKRHG